MQWGTRSTTGREEPFFEIWSGPYILEPVKDRVARRGGLADRAADGEAEDRARDLSVLAQDIVGLNAASFAVAAERDQIPAAEYQLLIGGICARGSKGCRKDTPLHKCICLDLRLNVKDGLVLHCLVHEGIMVVVRWIEAIRLLP